jgi:DNA-directed RNA polymerase alpha subunit
VEDIELNDTPKSLYKLAVEELDLSVETFNQIKSYSIDTVGDCVDLVDISDNPNLFRLPTMRKFSKTALDELRAKLQERGYYPPSN